MEYIVLIIDGYLEIVANVRSNFSYILCLRHLINIERSYKSDIYSPKRPKVSLDTSCLEKLVRKASYRNVKIARITPISLVLVVGEILAH